MAKTDPKTDAAEADFTQRQKVAMAAFQAFNLNDRVGIAKLGGIPGVVTVCFDIADEFLKHEG